MYNKVINDIVVIYRFIIQQEKVYCRIWFNRQNGF